MEISLVLLMSIFSGPAALAYVYESLHKMFDWYKKS